MKKDYIVKENDDQTEDEFIEKYWTDLWDKVTDISLNENKIKRSEEYRVIKPYLERIKSASPVLDGGCGTGEWSAFFSKQGHKAIAVDVSRKTIEKLTRIFPDVKFSIDDIRCMNIKSSSISAYYSWGVFEHFEEGMHRCVKEAYRVLEPGGYLFISVPFDNFRHAMLASFINHKKNTIKRNQFYQWRYTRNELTQELINGGFKVCEVVPIHKRQGILRFLHHEFKLPYSWFLTRALSYTLSFVIPGSLISHMILCVAVKEN